VVPVKKVIHTWLHGMKLKGLLRGHRNGLRKHCWVHQIQGVHSHVKTTFTSTLLKDVGS
jgi:hypothetical protein